MQSNQGQQQYQQNQNMVVFPSGQVPQSDGTNSLAKPSKSPKIRNGVIVLNQNGVQFQQQPKSNLNDSTGAKMQQQRVGNQRSVSLQNKRGSHPTGTI